jgi:hypothetical protein
MKDKAKSTAKRPAQRTAPCIRDERASRIREEALTAFGVVLYGGGHDRRADL